MIVSEGVTNIQEDIENRSIALAIKTAKVTEQVLAKALVVLVQKVNQSRNAPKVGKQSYERLSRGGDLSNVKITDDNIKAFDPIAREFKIGYSLKKDASTEPPTWYVFFKAKDADAMTAAFTKFTNRTLKHQVDKPSVLETMRNFREKMKNVVRDKIKVKHRGGPEL